LKPSLYSQISSSWAWNKDWNNLYYNNWKVWIWTDEPVTELDVMWDISENHIKLSDKYILKNSEEFNIWKWSLYKNWDNLSLSYSWVLQNTFEKDLSWSGWYITWKNPISNNHLATKEYVDNRISAIWGWWWIACYVSTPKVNEDAEDCISWFTEQWKFLTETFALTDSMQYGTRTVPYSTFTNKVARVCCTEKLKKDITYSWQMLDTWGECNKTCGWWTRQKNVICKSSDWDTVGDFYCTSEKPSESETCNTQACITYSWVAWEWWECDNYCGDAKRYRSVQCKNSKWESANDLKCVYSDYLSWYESCDNDPCIVSCNESNVWKFNSSKQKCVIESYNRDICKTKTTWYRADIYNKYDNWSPDERIRNRWPFESSEMLEEWIWFSYDYFTTWWWKSFKWGTRYWKKYTKEDSYCSAYKNIPVYSFKDMPK